MAFAQRSRHLAWLTLQPQAIDVARGGEPPDESRMRVLPSLRVDDVLEEKRLAVLFFDAPAELPADERMHLGVFVDLFTNANELPVLFQDAEELSQIGVAALFGHVTI